MTLLKSLSVTAVAGLLFLAAEGSALAGTAGTKIDVSLWDNGTSAEMKTDMGVGMAGDHMKANMGLKLSTDQAKAGDVTFDVTNSSKETVHEMVVIPFPADGKVPYSEKDAKFDEDAAGHLGEVSELEPGKTGSLTLSLKPGKYILSCNIPNHYANGMWAVITVSE